MGLIDVLNGMQNGPHGQRDPSASTSSKSGGMSPMTMAILGLLAYKAVKGFAGNQQSTAPANTRIPPGPNPTSPDQSASASAGGGGLGDLLKGGLGGLLAGGAAGSVLSGGLNDLLKQFQQSGQSETVNSWVGTGPNKQISPNDLGGALGSDKINALVEQTGMSRDELLRGLSQYLPQVVDQLTPHGRVPTEQEVHRLL
ncbi:MAG TPA: YidB family protein [Pseudolabrys sp.]|jgi:uncharacterized protein YidB (DUF937 family)|nr:YidB family protein [Pseudolabrys sp.]